MEKSGKRKGGPSNGSHGGSQPKRSKGGSGNKWQTPSQREKLDSLRTLQVGDVGVWVTCQRGKERQARAEMARICDDYGKKLYNIDPPDEHAEAGNDDEEGGAEDDIEASIQRELEGMKPANRPKDPPFETVRSGLDCLFFLRTRPPVDPIELARQICLDAAKPAVVAVPKEGGDAGDDAGIRGGATAIGISRFVNRFTPVTVLGRATEKNLDELARQVLAEHFRLAGDDGDGDDDSKPENGDGSSESAPPPPPPSSYAIRPTFRAHNLLKRDDVIKKIASLVDVRHKVNLTSPDKVVLVDIYQTFCGMSVVPGDWESLKRYNIHELKMAAAGVKKDGAAEAKGDAYRKAKAESKGEGEL
ncbi:hypothetical protein Micbo1qcDRAFT_72236 [Microdochium bolleyi]|uniref:THUMP domain-containing protein n=1 Tax=Microdochium bolleyi TaxID=196109 RepID=A0A136J0P1_9PEZI|nr:hypothetical protein Micbo1qcDRAFT_72236 [Microdochium bolleyi]